MASDLQEYEWIVVFGGFVAFAAAFGIGANDVANAYATSVGSKALTIKQACFLAVIFEFLGAFLAGSQVTDTIRQGIADYECFSDDPALLMYGCLIVIISVAIWLLVATKYEMPVSTTHSCVGGMIGMTIVAKGGGCVNWSSAGNEDNLYLPKGVAAIILSWILSPVLSGILAAGLFGSIRKFILRATDSFSKAMKFYPLLMFVAVLLNTFFIISKGINKKVCPKKADEAGFLCKTDEDGDPSGKVEPMAALGLSAAVAAGVAIMSIPMLNYIKGRVEERMAAGPPKTTSSKSDVENKDVKADDAAPQADNLTMMERISKSMERISKSMMKSLNHDVHSSVESDATVAAIHAHAEKFEPRTEMYFEYIQIFTAIVDSFAHGANDVANAMGPYMAIWSIYHSGKVSKKTSDDYEDDSLWILALGGIGIGVGLCLYGYQIIQAIGVKLAVITPPRGVCIELGSATVIIFGSYLGLPLSTTHCQVGATTGVALLEGKEGINTWVLGKTVVGWIITLVVVGCTTGILLAQGINAPLTDGKVDVILKEECPAWAPNHGWILNSTTI